jgi:hypothetical protein
VTDKHRTRSGERSRARYACEFGGRFAI